MTNAPAMPPLTTWQQIWRLGLTALLGLIGFGITVASASHDGGPPSGRDNVILAIDFFAAGPISLVLLWFRRRWPVPIALAITTLGAVSITAGVAAMVALVSVSARRRVAEIVPVGLWVLVTSLIYELWAVPAAATSPWWVALIMSVIFAAALIAWGLFLGTRRELRQTERQRVLDLEREQGLRMVGARAQERARIAREMHDIVGHRISLIAVHAGALAYRSDLEPAQVRREAEIIQQSATAALQELRQVLGVLRDPAQVAEEAPSAGGLQRPQPTVADLDELVEEARRSGQLVEYTVDLPAGPPPPELGRHVFRAVQECLTNARKHAPGAPVAIRIHGAPGADLVTEVHNGRAAKVVAPQPGSGLGLVGVAERAAIAGGTLEHGRTTDGGWSVRLVLPWTASATVVA